MRKVQVIDYDPSWPALFEQLRTFLWPAVCDIALTIEHVGSTSVPGIAAKPVIDLDIVIPTRNELPAVIARLARIGYQYEGNLGIQDREAFRAALDTPAHNLYVCPQESAGLRNHIAFRDHLRAHPGDAARYAVLKKQLAARYPDDVNSYAEAKTDFVLSILVHYGLGPDAQS